MGRRRGTETAFAIVRAFRERTTWAQHDLARVVGITPRALRSALVECARAGLPIERQEENRSLVYWSVSREWARGLEGDELATCVRFLSRLPSTLQRDRLLARLVGRDAPPNVVGERERILRVLEDAAAAKRVARFLYRSAKDADARERCASIHAIEHGPRARFIATCHEADCLKTFRVERVERATLEPSASFRGVASEAIERYVAESLDGFHGSELSHVSFVVRAREARWVGSNLPAGRLDVEPRSDGSLRVHGITAAKEVLARFLVGLGDAVRIETPELRDRVTAIARASLLATTSAPRPLARQGGPNRAGSVATKSETR